MGNPWGMGVHGLLFVSWRPQKAAPIPSHHKIIYRLFVQPSRPTLGR
jgi:hypothetical protein